MSFFKGFLGKKKHHNKEDNMDRMETTRHSMRAYDESMLPPCYQAVGKRRPRGPLSCPGGDQHMNVHFSRDDRSFRSRRHDVDRSSDYSSQEDPSPLERYKHRKERYYHSGLDDSEDDRSSIDQRNMMKIREKLRKAESEILSLRKELRSLRVENEETEKLYDRRNQILIESGKTYRDDRDRFKKERDQMRAERDHYKNKYKELKMQTQNMRKMTSPFSSSFRTPLFPPPSLLPIQDGAGEALFNQSDSSMGYLSMGNSNMSRSLTGNSVGTPRYDHSSPIETKRDSRLIHDKLEPVEEESTEIRNRRAASLPSISPKNNTLSPP